MTQLSWFSARLLFEARPPGATALQAVYEDRIVLLEAEDETDAMLKAGDLGEAADEESRSEYEGSIAWEFIEVLDLEQLPVAVLQHGAQVYFQYLDARDLAAVRRSLKPGKFDDGGESPSK
jgi:hypothetical protein